MKRFFIFGATFLALSSTAFATDASSPYRGYTEINSTIRERILIEGSTTNLGKYVGENLPEPRVLGGVLALLGTYVGSDQDAQFRNGDPNEINLILWYLAFSGMASDIANHCNPAVNTLPLLPEFRSTMSKLCAWPAAEAKTDEVLMAYWTELTQFDAPGTEFEAWKSFFLNSDYANRPAKEVITAMTLSAWMNPYFLLKN